MPNTADLTTLGSVKGWLGQEVGSASDALLAQLITAASRFVSSYIQRNTLASHSVQEVRDGGGNSFMVLRQWPVLSVQSVQFTCLGVNITTESAGNPRTPGFFLDLPPDGAGQQRLTLVGWCFPRGRSNVVVSYMSGYIQTEADVVPAVADGGGHYIVTPQAMWLQDEGVTLSSGTSLVAVSGTSPGPLQYGISDGEYYFNAAQAGAAVSITYSYVPEDIQHAVDELVGERFKARTRIGENSKTLGGKETISYSTKDMNDFVETSLNPYRRIV